MMLSEFLYLDPELEGMVRIIACIFLGTMVISIASVL